MVEPWWEWAAELRRRMEARAALRMELDAAREAGKAIRHRKRLELLARRKREAS